jgi:hypothetical protein
MPMSMLNMPKSESKITLSSPDRSDEALEL